MGYLAPARVCQGCKALLEEEDLKDRIVWRMVRLEAAVADRLIPYFHPGDETQWDRCLRAMVGSALKAVPPLQRATSALAGEALEVLGKYGLSGMAGVLLRREFVEAVEVLKEVAGVDRHHWPVSVPQLEAAMFYLLAKGRGERGADPEAEHEAHRTCPPVSDAALQELLAVAPLALHFAYAETPVMQQLKAQQQGWRLVFAHPQQAGGPGQPGFALYCHLRDKTACLAVRGPDTVQDVLPELRGLPLPFPHDGRSGGGSGHGGWAQLSTEWQAAGAVGEAGHWLFAEAYPHLKRLLDDGYQLTLTGHSLGGAIAALLGVLLREEGITEGVRCVGFGTPSCVNARLAQACAGFGTVLILHDDVVPRVTPSGVRGLLRDLLSEKDAVAQHWKEDVEAIIVKRQGKWAPRWRRLGSAAAVKKGGGGGGGGGRRPRSRSGASSLWGGSGGGDAEEDVASFVRSEEDEAAAAGGAGTEARGPRHAGGGGGVEGANNEGWDSCDDDFGEYWGIGCLRPEALASASAAASAAGAGKSKPNSYSIRHEDGTTTTVDLSEARRRLLAGTSGGGSAAAAAAAPPPAPAPPSFGGREEEEEEGGGFGAGGFGATILGRGDDYGSEEEEEGSVRSRGSGGLPFGQRSDGGGWEEEEEGEESPARQQRRDGRDGRDGRRREEEEEEEEALFPMAAAGGGFGGLGGSDGEEEEEEAEAEAALPDFFGLEEQDDEEQEQEEAPAARKEEKERELSNSSASSSSSSSSSLSPPPASKPPPPQAVAAAAAAARSPPPALRPLPSADSPPLPPQQQQQQDDDDEDEDGYPAEPEPSEEGELDEEEEEECVLVEEGGLPELYPPGRIVHIYGHRGVYRACMPPRDFPPLRRIALQGNLLRDHDPEQYFQALCEAIDARRAPSAPPPWEGFEEKDACACCAVDLTWRWGAASEAQRYRDKHNCRCCGRLVCEACSGHRKALPSIGLALPARVCDRCFFGGKHSATGGDVVVVGGSGGKGVDG